MVDPSVGKKDPIFTLEDCPVAKGSLGALPGVVAVIGMHARDNHRTCRGIPIRIESEERIRFPG
jgi:hypothetical protein